MKRIKIIFFFFLMITRIDNIEYCKLNELQDNIAAYD